MCGSICLEQWIIQVSREIWTYTNEVQWFNQYFCFGTLIYTTCILCVSFIENNFQDVWAKLICYKTNRKRVIQVMYVIE